MKSRTQWAMFAVSVLLAGGAALAADAPRTASDSKRAETRIVHVQDDATAGGTTSAAPRNDQTTQVQSVRSRRLRFHRDTCSEPGLAASLANRLGFTQLDQSCDAE